MQGDENHLYATRYIVGRVLATFMRTSAIMSVFAVAVFVIAMVVKEELLRIPYFWLYAVLEICVLPVLVALITASFTLDALLDARQDCIRAQYDKLYKEEWRLINQRRNRPRGGLRGRNTPLALSRRLPR